MTYMELLQHFEREKELILADTVNEMLTKNHRYVRTPDGWAMDACEGTSERVYTRGGMVYRWEAKGRSH